MTETEKKLEKLLYCCDGLSTDYCNGNYGDAKEWLRHINTVYQDYQEAVDEDKARKRASDITLHGLSGHW